MCTTQVKFNTPSAKRGGPSNGVDDDDDNDPTVASATAAATAAAAATGDGTPEDRRDSGEGPETAAHVGFLKEWTLMLHGTREPPYGQLSVRDPHSKLAIVKKAHTITGPETTVTQPQQSAY